ncbi:MAG: DUF5012 domain-containing protein [Flavobacterium sp.]|nr:DUF5012 domain-containing protein [Flavobacterium sp.]
MKKLFILPILALFFASCSDETTGDVSKVTNYPIFTVLGDDVIILTKGDPFTDPGVIVMEGENEIEYTTTISGDFRGGTSIDTNVADIYHITYSATNVDGFSGTAGRTVIVVDNGNLVNSISGLYTSTVVRNGVVSAQYTDMEYVIIWENANGTYEMSDGIGGYYAIGRGYGTGYAARPVVITANSIPANDFTVTNFGVGAFGGDAEMSGLTVNPIPGTITFSTAWDAGFTFNVTLKKVEL